jgi:hypothetical protein
MNEATADKTRAALAGRDSSELLCPTCGGNDRNMPCAYPGERLTGCIHSARVERLENELRCLLEIGARRTLLQCEVLHGEALLAESRA